MSESTCRYNKLFVIQSLDGWILVGVGVADRARSLFLAFGSLVRELLAV